MTNSDEIFFSIVDISVQKFIRENEKIDITDLLLKKNKDIDKKNWQWNEIATQIEGRKKLAQKINSWYNDTIIITQKLALEQCSSENIAKIKAKIIGNGKKLIDLTGGFGVDTYFLGQNFEHIFHIEPNQNLQNIVKENFKQLNFDKVYFYNQNAEQFLAENILNPNDIIYIDPSRRDAQGQKVFRWKDLLPDVINIWHYLEKVQKIMIKTSPLVDISQGIKELKNPPEKIFIIGTKNEVKEVLFFWENNQNIKKNHEIDIKIEVFTIEKEIYHHFNFDLLAEKNTEIEYSLPQKYIYEPFPTILKSGAFQYFAKKYNLKKLHLHTHLYTSETLCEEAQARIFEVENVCQYDKKIIQKIIPEKKANITTRNFPENVTQIRKKLALAEGGEKYIFAAKNLENKLVLIVCKK
ncbi:MAG: class I SAM-dependent methyltransferase [Bacteroidetes bacterium]|nr:MAG: class I SAM-dependent methyltransferase [Bacteroidota bacterium]TAG94300.1 MAG: class I SAM-dependent methyltransferase [Bacteroidota bacterium]